MSAELKAEDRDWNLERVERFLQERHAGAEGEGLSEFDDETYQLAREVKKRKKSNVVPILTSVGALTIFGAVVWYAYNWNEGQLSPDALPVIVTHAGPIKERPAEEGGLDIPYRDRAVLNDGLDGAEAEAVEHLLPPPEEPASVQASAEASAAVADGATAGDVGRAVIVAEAAEEGTTSASEAPAPVQSVPSSEPAAETTTAAAGANAAAAVEPASPPKAADQPQDAKVAQVPTDGGYFLQLASVQDRSNVDSEWKRLQKMFPALLGDMSLQIEEALVNGKTFYRLKTGPFPTRATAEDVCAQLKTKKQACLLKRQG